MYINCKLILYIREIFCKNIKLERLQYELWESRIFKMCYVYSETKSILIFYKWIEKRMNEWLVWKVGEISQLYPNPINYIITFYQKVSWSSLERHCLKCFCVDPALFFKTVEVNFTITKWNKNSHTNLWVVR